MNWILATLIAAVSLEAVAIAILAVRLRRRKVAEGEPLEWKETHFEVDFKRVGEWLR